MRLFEIAKLTLVITFMSEFHRNNFLWRIHRNRRAIWVCCLKKCLFAATEHWLIIYGQCWHVECFVICYLTISHTTRETSTSTRNPSIAWDHFNDFQVIQVNKQKTPIQLILNENGLFLEFSIKWIETETNKIACVAQCELAKHMGSIIRIVWMYIVHVWWFMS